MWVIDAETWRQRLGFAGGEQEATPNIIVRTFRFAPAPRHGFAELRTAVNPSWGAAQHRSARRCSWSPIDAATDGDPREGGTSLHLRRPTASTRPSNKPAQQQETRTSQSPAAGTLLRQAIALGLLDELELHIARSSSATACACSTTDSSSTHSKESSSHRNTSPRPTTSHTSATEYASVVRSYWTTVDATRRRGWHNSQGVSDDRAPSSSTRRGWGNPVSARARALARAKSWASADLTNPTPGIRSRS